jgi:hypothetical protein
MRIREALPVLRYPIEVSVEVSVETGGSAAREVGRRRTNVEDKRHDLAMASLVISPGARTSRR